MTTLAERLRPTIRARLTFIYGGVFLVGGMVLLALTYFLVKTNMQRSGGSVTQVFGTGVGQDATPRFLNNVDPDTPMTAGQAQRVLFAANIDYQRDALNSLLTRGGIALGVVTVAAVGLGWLFADRALRPVHQITETARRVAHSRNLTERIAYSGPRDDVKELADTFDTMLGRLARAFDGQQRFAANASHELRTPLAINRTLVDVALRRPDATEDVKRLGESLLIVNGRHERLIDGLLTLAGSENTVVNGVQLDLSDVAGHVLDQATAEASARGITVGRDLLGAPTTGDPVLIERIVQNLVENAIRHNDDGGEISVTTRRGAELVVANTGPVVPAYEVDTIFEPFRRLGTDRIHSDRGSGLGLSIVRATTTAHGGTVTAEPRAGGGLTVTVLLPGR
ncbi:HAMP domain-containing sensor histidine kinase [Actinomadura sp. DC4]|uniref:sensor histidine kinase n=1 Tax=Actinomadura sp. DC4 TaxID=3055069 RepID=UPI0025B07962|nr:HAMP domain-containing sensor histidine kinase [Actinomadura sp. DC4]MDN3352481.1 HAMP domain-containing sensor histidine kinase [Actinomadura sp. DC4]